MASTVSSPFYRGRRRQPEPESCARRCARSCRPIWFRRVSRSWPSCPAFSGKVDRKALKRLPLTTPAGIDDEQETRATRPRRSCARRPSACCRRADPLRRRFLHRSRRPFAARRQLFRRGARDARARLGHAAGCLCLPHAARDRRHLAGRADMPRPARSLLRAAAAAAALPVRPRAGGRAAVHPRDRHRAMARRVRQLQLLTRRTPPCSRNSPRCSASTSA